MKFNFEWGRLMLYMALLIRWWGNEGFSSLD
jgi:hypothetical protein